MKDLTEFKNRQIEALQKEVAELNRIKYQYATWIQELADTDTPQEYKNEVLREVIKNY